MSNSKAIEILSLYKSQVIDFINELIELLPDQGSLVALRLFIQNVANIQDGVDHFVFVLNRDNKELKNTIKDRNEDFFRKDGLSSFLNTREEHTNSFREIWFSDRIDNDDKEAIWNWVDIFVKLAERYENANKTG